MSFGYSVGNFIAGANLSYRLIRCLSDSRGACMEYQEAIAELGSIQQAFLQVSQMRADSRISQSTINAASHIVISSMEIIGRFLERTRNYQKRLSSGDGWTKIGWTLFKKEELRSLRDSLHVKLSAVNTLLSVANFHGEGISTVEQYRVRPHQHKAMKQDEEVHFSNPPSCTTIEAEEEPTMEDGSLYDASTINAEGILESDAEKSVVDLDSCMNAKASVVDGIDVKSIQCNDPAEHTSIPKPQVAANNVKPSINVAPRPKKAAMVSIEERCARIEKLILARIGNERPTDPSEERQAPIKFKDAVGRKFSFPFHLCKKWSGMEDLIRQAFLHVDVLGPHVAEGRYDLVGPNGDIILPQVWERTIDPDWTITMHMWPMPEPEKTKVSELLRIDGDDVPALEDGLKPPKPKRNEPNGIMNSKNRWNRAVQAWRGLSHSAEGNLGNSEEE